MVYVGALRPQGFGGLDRRLWALVALDMVFLIPASRGGLASIGIVVGIGLLVYFGGRLIGRYSPFMLDEIGHYIEWRLIAPLALIPDDAHFTGEDPHWSQSWKGSGFGRV